MTYNLFSKDKTFPTVLVDNLIIVPDVEYNTLISKNKILLIASLIN
jgi:hypothetical protein